MKKIITISTLFIGATMAYAAPMFPNTPQAEIVACSQKGGAASAEKIMQIQAKEGLDVSRDTFLIYQLAYCEGAKDVLLAAAKKDNSYAIKAIKMLRLADAEDTLLGLVKAKANSAKDAIDALTTCGSEKSLKFFVDNMATADSLIGDYVKVSAELYKALDETKVAAMKSAIEGKIASADGKAKAALERIIVDTKGKAATEEAPAATGRKARKNKA
ncbi:MAG: hypothetical protein R3Y46_03870 [Opitutales bacterium]